MKAPGDQRWRAFPGIDEDRYPVFLAVPILGHDRVLGAIVVQRAGDKAYRPSDVRLLVALLVGARTRHLLLVLVRDRGVEVGGLALLLDGLVVQLAEKIHRPALQRASKLPCGPTVTGVIVQ